jgi:hypothetical protein
MRTRESPAKQEQRRTSAFLRGWDDSEHAYVAPSAYPVADRYDYMVGWWAAADWRHGRAPGPEGYPR